MKICPRCQKTYADDNLNFCLEDGSTLTQMAGTPPPPTVQMQQPFPTQGPTGGQQTGQAGWNVGQQPYTMQPAKKSSRAWIWVLLILGVLVLVCGGGFAGLIYLGSQESARQVNSTASNSNSSGFSNSNSNSSASTTGRTSVTRVDLAKWEQNSGTYGNTDFSDGEFRMSSSTTGYYYVLMGGRDNKTVNADTLVTARNIDDAATTLGFGLVFHSNPKPLQQGYALLVDSKKKRYRVVHHEPKKETAVVNWTTSDAILDGTSENKLEVRDQGDSIDIYINGKKVNSIKNVHGYPNGVVGLYAGDGIKIGFKDLEIRK